VLGNEPPKSGPEVAFIVKTFTLSGDRKWLAWAATCPDWSVVGPTNQPQCVSPSSNACEKVVLRVSVKVAGSDILDAPFVYVAGGYQVRGDQLTEPRSRLRVNFVVVGHRLAAASSSASLILPRLMI
jgi:hypothetical protein